MRLEHIHERPGTSLAAEIGIESAERDRDGQFPEAGFATLRDRGLIGWPPLKGAEIVDLLQTLAEVGRGDLSVGRIFEGHVNALFLIESYGNPIQRARYEAVAAAGGIFGVWNTDAPQNPLRREGRRFVGKKNYASGVDGLSHAIVTITEPLGRTMITVPLDGLPVDRSWWTPMGMRASGSHIVDFTDVEIQPEWILGQPDDYIRQPWFSSGAIRFAAVHVGGMHAVFDTAVHHLSQTKRTADPYQSHRIARMGIAVESGYAWLERAADAWRTAAADGAAPATGESLMATANATRMAVESLALSVLEEAERSVGAAGLMAPHALERLDRDLRTYLRQPNPDGALAALGSAIASGSWRPGKPLGDRRG